MLKTTPMDTNEKHLNYDHFTNYTISELPQFAQIVFVNKHISDKEKFRFVELVLNPYMTDQDFRDGSQEHYVFFVTWRLFGIAKTTKEMNVPPEYPGYNIYGVLMTDNPIKAYLLSLAQVGISINSCMNPNLPRIEFNSYYNDHIYKEKRLVDTGASYTTIPVLDKWDYISGNGYLDQIEGIGRYTYNYSVLNDNIESVFDLPIDTGT